MRYLRRRKFCPICDCSSSIPGRKKEMFFLNINFNLEQATTPSVHSMIRRVIEQRNKKNLMEYGWLSKTGKLKAK
jgi:hypothetical protein